MRLKSIDRSALRSEEPVYMTFKELRERQRIAEKSHIGPADYQKIKPFAENNGHKVRFEGRP